jgi:Carboxypeptidase regulatory-like domain
MSLTAQTTRIIFAALAVCVVSSAASAQLTEQTEKKVGGSTIRGTVVYADTGRPLRYARIVLIADVGEGDFEGVSDKRGEFVVENVPAGRYVLSVDAPGVLQPGEYKLRSGPVIPQLKLSERSDLYTEVSVNGTDSVEIKVRAVRGGVITGRVLAEDDLPLANAGMKLLRRENGKWMPVNGAWNVYPRDNDLQTTDASGVYRFAGLRAGDYLVRASEPTVAAHETSGLNDVYSNGSFMATYHPSAVSLKDAQAVTVVEGSEATGVDIRMPERAPHTLTGTVTVGPNNAPAGWAEVLIERREEVGFVRHGFGDATVRADGEGKWQMPGLPPGEYLVTIGGLVKSAPSEGHVNVPLQRTVVRIRDEAVTVLNTTLSRGAHLGGKIVLNGKQLENTYQLRPNVLPVDRKDDRSDNEGTEVTEAPGYWRSVESDGDFYVNGVPAGNYWFVMSNSSPDFYVKSVTRKGVDLMQTPVKTVDGAFIDDIVVTLATDFARVEAQVKLPDNAPKKSPGDVLVIVTPANDATRRYRGEPRTFQPDAQGKIVFTSMPGEYFIAAFTAVQIKKPGTSLEKYFEKETEKVHRIKLKAGETNKGITLTVVDK